MKAILQNGRYILTQILGSVVYGVIIYFVYTWLAGYSLQYAYFANLALIILMIALEEYSIKKLESDDVFNELSDPKNIEKTYRTLSGLQKNLEHYFSFKTVLYIFYVVILILSQIVEYNPDLISGDLHNFISANSYSILLLIAIDRLIAQFTSDRRRTKKLVARIKQFLASHDK